MPSASLLCISLQRKPIDFKWPQLALRVPITDGFSSKQLQQKQVYLCWVACPIQVTSPCCQLALLQECWVASTDQCHCQDWVCQAWAQLQYQAQEQLVFVPCCPQVVSIWWVLEVSLRALSLDSFWHGGWGMHCSNFRWALSHHIWF